MLDGECLKQHRKAWNGEQTTKSKGDRKTYRKVTRIHLYTVKILPAQAWARGAVGDGQRVTHATLEERSFELLTSANAMWAIRESCSVQVNVSIGQWGWKTKGRRQGEEGETGQEGQARWLS